MKRKVKKRGGGKIGGVYHNGTGTSQRAARKQARGKADADKRQVVDLMLQQAASGKADEGMTPYDLGVALDREKDINHTISSRLHGLREDFVVCNHSLTGEEIFFPPRGKVEVVERKGDAVRQVYYLSKKFINASKAQQEIMMASKKKTEKATEKDPREWHKKAATVFLDQAGEGKSLEGFTFSEIRKVMGLNQGDTGFAEIAAAVTDLRNEGFLAHKFSHPSLKEDFYEGDPTEIPNIQKRENEAKVRQLVFFVHPALMALGDNAAEAVGTGEFPEDFEYDSPATIFDRDEIYAWFDGLGEVIDLYVEDEEQKALGAKMIAALMPEKAKE